MFNKLSPNEKIIASKLRTGKKSAEIAKDMGTSRAYVTGAIAMIRIKYHVSTTNELIVALVNDQLFDVYETFE